MTAGEVRSPPRRTDHAKAGRVLRGLLDAANAAAFRAVWLGAVALLRVFFGLRVENPPRLRGPFILASNHASFMDPVVLQAGLRRRVFYLMTEVYWKARGMGWFFRFARAIPIRTTGEGNRESLAAALRLLRDGAVVAIFPEGTRSLDGRLQAGRAGVALLALGSGAPVVPAALIGTRRALPPGARFIRPARLRIRFGEPLRFEKRPGVPRRDLYRETTDAVMASLERLLEGNPSQR